MKKWMYVFAVLAVVTMVLPLGSRPGASKTMNCSIDPILIPVSSSSSLQHAIASVSSMPANPPGNAQQSRNGSFFLLTNKI